MRRVREGLFSTVGRLLRHQPTSPAKVEFAWRSAVGASMARATSVRLEPNGILRIAADSEHWRREASRSADVIAERMTVLLGRGIVRQIAFEKGSS